MNKINENVTIVFVGENLISDRDSLITIISSKTSKIVWDKKSMAIKYGIANLKPMYFDFTNFFPVAKRVNDNDIDDFSELPGEPNP